MDKIGCHPCKLEQTRPHSPTGLRLRLRMGDAASTGEAPHQRGATTPAPPPANEGVDISERTGGARPAGAEARGNRCAKPAPQS